MRISGAFVLGTLMGAAAVWLWGREVEAYVEEKARGVRTKVAQGVRAVEAHAERVLDRGGDALRRADDFLEVTRQDVRSALRAGEDAIRPAPAATEA